MPVPRDDSPAGHHIGHAYTRRWTVKRLVVAALLAGGIAMLPNPTPADAQNGKLNRCLDEALVPCDEDFDGNSIYVIAARGYCYMIRTGMCYLY